MRITEDALRAPASLLPVPHAAWAAALRGLMQNIPEAKPMFEAAGRTSEDVVRELLRRRG